MNSRFVGGGLSFAVYVQRTQAMLRQVHAGKNEEEEIVAGNSPFELLPTGNFEKGRDKPYRRGILLTHGLTDSPYHMRHLAAFFQRMGFRVMAVLLPGHGTQPGDLLDVRWQEWEKALIYGADTLAAEVDELYLGGLSAGAALSVLQGIEGRAGARTVPVLARIQDHFSCEVGEPAPSLQQVPAEGGVGGRDAGSRLVQI